MTREFGGLSGVVAFQFWEIGTFSYNTAIGEFQLPTVLWIVKASAPSRTKVWQIWMDSGLFPSKAAPCPIHGNFNLILAACWSFGPQPRTRQLMICGIFVAGTEILRLCKVMEQSFLKMRQAQPRWSETKSVVNPPRISRCSIRVTCHHQILEIAKDMFGK